MLPPTGTCHTIREKETLEFRIAAPILWFLNIGHRGSYDCYIFKPNQRISVPHFLSFILPKAQISSPTLPLNIYIKYIYFFCSSCCLEDMELVVG